MRKNILRKLKYAAALVVTVICGTFAGSAYAAPSSPALTQIFMTKAQIDDGVNF